MEKKRNQKNNHHRLHHHHNHHQHHLPDAYEQYEAEHMAPGLRDSHERPSARVNSNEFEETNISPKAEKKIAVDYYWRVPDDSTSTDRKSGTYDEEVDAKAAEFIKMEHKKLGLRKLISTDGYRAS